MTKTIITLVVGRNWQAIYKNGVLSIENETLSIDEVIDALGYDKDNCELQFTQVYLGESEFPYNLIGVDLTDTGSQSSIIPDISFDRQPNDGFVFGNAVKTETVQPIVDKSDLVEVGQEVYIPGYTGILLTVTPGKAIIEDIFENVKEVEREIYNEDEDEDDYEPEYETVVEVEQFLSFKGLSNYIESWSSLKHLQNKLSSEFQGLDAKIVS